MGRLARKIKWKIIDIKNKRDEKRLRKVAENGSPQAQVAYGDWLMNRQRYEEAKRWFLEAVAQGYSHAQEKMRQSTMEAELAELKQLIVYVGNDTYSFFGLYRIGKSNSYVETYEGKKSNAAKARRWIDYVKEYSVEVRLENIKTTYPDEKRIIELIKQYESNKSTADEMISCYSDTLSSLVSNVNIGNSQKELRCDTCVHYNDPYGDCPYEPTHRSQRPPFCHKHR